MAEGVEELNGGPEMTVTEHMALLGYNYPSILSTAPSSYPYAWTDTDPIENKVLEVFSLDKTKGPLQNGEMVDYLEDGHFLKMRLNVTMSLLGTIADFGQGLCSEVIVCPHEPVGGDCHECELIDCWTGHFPTSRPYREKFFAERTLRRHIAKGTATVPLLGARLSSVNVHEKGRTVKPVTEVVTVDDVERCIVVNDVPLCSLRDANGISFSYLKLRYVGTKYDYVLSLGPPPTVQQKEKAKPEQKSKAVAQKATVGAKGGTKPNKMTKKAAEKAVAAKRKLQFAGDQSAADDEGVDAAVADDCDGGTHVATGGFEAGAGVGGFEAGAGVGGFEAGAGVGGFEGGAGVGGFEAGAGVGGFAAGAAAAAVADGSQDADTPPLVICEKPAVQDEAVSKVVDQTEEIDNNPLAVLPEVTNSVNSEHYMPEQEPAVPECNGACCAYIRRHIADLQRAGAEAPPQHGYDEFIDWAAESREAQRRVRKSTSKEKSVDVLEYASSQSWDRQRNSPEKAQRMWEERQLAKPVVDEEAAAALQKQSKVHKRPGLNRKPEWEQFQFNTDQWALWTKVYDRKLPFRVKFDPHYVHITDEMRQQCKTARTNVTKYMSCNEVTDAGIQYLQNFMAAVFGIAVRTRAFVLERKPTINNSAGNSAKTIIEAQPPPLQEGLQCFMEEYKLQELFAGRTQTEVVRGIVANIASRIRTATTTLRKNVVTAKHD